MLAHISKKNSSQNLTHGLKYVKVCMWNISRGRARRQDPKIYRLILGYGRSVLSFAGPLTLQSFNKSIENVASPMSRNKSLSRVLGVYTWGYRGTPSCDGHCNRDLSQFWVLYYVFSMTILQHTWSTPSFLLVRCPNSLPQAWELSMCVNRSLYDSRCNRTVLQV